MNDFTGQMIGRYQILELIGKGGMAVVYKAVDTRLESEVAIKFINKDEFPASVHEEMSQRFKSEAKLMANLNHPNIVKVIDSGELEGYPYLVMPYLPGGTLKERMGKPIPWHEVIQIILPLTMALNYTHQQPGKPIHRDIKPSNILMTASGEPVLTDFGIVKIREDKKQQTLTGTGVGMGTTLYMAPEQLTGKKLDERADIYALGVVMYEMLTGRLPYNADTPFELAFKMAKEQLPRPKLFVLDLPDKVERVVIKAIAKAPEDRYQSMEEFGKELNGLVSETMPFIVPKWIYLAGIGVVILASGLMFLWTLDSGIPKPVSTLISSVATIPVPTTMGFATTSLPTAMAHPTNIVTVQPTKTNTPLPEPTVAPTIGIGSTLISPKDGMVMVYVPEGEFEMGSNDGDDNEKPVHTVYLDGYWIDQTEVTNAMFAIFVQATGYETDAEKRGIGWIYSNNNWTEILGANWQAPQGLKIDNSKNNHPVLQVSWNDASAYCQWAERRLPSEAEWEKAACGTDGRVYPWGNQIPNTTFLNYDESIGETTEVGSYPAGASPYGALDMAGNVWEWTADWYGTYPSSLVNNPIGVVNGKYRTLRGGSWYFYDYLARCSNRDVSTPDASNDNLGFRCALTP